MRGWLVLVATTIALAGCGSDADPPERSSPTGTTATATGASPGAAGVTDADIGPERYDAAACPVPDGAFCATAIEVVEALQAGDADRLLALSREGRLVCAEVATDYFPGARLRTPS